MVAHLTTSGAGQGYWLTELTGLYLKRVVPVRAAPPTPLPHPGQRIRKKKEQAPALVLAYMHILVGTPVRQGGPVQAQHHMAESDGGDGKGRRWPTAAPGKLQHAVHALHRATKQQQRQAQQQPQQRTWGGPEVGQKLAHSGQLTSARRPPPASGAAVQGWPTPQSPPRSTPRYPRRPHGTLAWMTCAEGSVGR
jgi:hypothetical protein